MFHCRLSHVLRRSHPPLVPALAVAFVSGASVAQEAPTAKPPAPPPATNPLLGPSVAPAAVATTTLIQRDFAGKLVRLEVPPAEAAVKALDLDPPTRAKVDSVLLARSALLDRLVGDNLKLLVKLQAARQSQDKDETRKLFEELFEKSEPLRARGTLANELTGVLTPDQASRLRSMTEEYVKASIDERAAEKGSGKGLTLVESLRIQREAAREETFSIIGQELKRAYERTVGQRIADFDKLLKDFNVTPEQESKIRKIVQDNFTATYGKPTPQQRAKAFTEIYALLDAGQREQLLKRVAEERAGSHGR
jgi:hypothetical protein